LVVFFSSLETSVFEVGRVIVKGWPEVVRAVEEDERNGEFLA
jgi:hypothetical protein